MKTEKSAEKPTTPAYTATYDAPKTSSPIKVSLFGKVFPPGEAVTITEEQAVVGAQMRVPLVIKCGEEQIYPALPEAAEPEDASTGEE